MDKQSPIGKVSRLRTSPESCSYGAGRFEVNEKGVFYIPPKEGGKETPQWLSSPLYVVAKTRDEHGNEWGRLLRWEDDDGLTHERAISMAMLEGDPAEARQILASEGLHTADGPRRSLLLTYIKVWPVGKRVRCVSRLGWHGSVFVTPNGSIGDTDEQYVYQNPHALDAVSQACGTLKGWREGVARLAQGNSRLVFSICAALSGPLFEMAQEGTGGFHLRSLTTVGKSTALKVAASVWGNPEAFIRLWRLTTNGLEGLACLHSDRILILDELGQAEAHIAGEAAYLLANGQGKVRAKKDGTARTAQRWRTPFLSAGELTLAALTAQAGKRTTGGQEVRFADIEADAGVGFGLFERLHEFSSVHLLASALSELSGQEHGVIGIAWLGELVKHREELVSKIPQEIVPVADRLTPPGANGPVQRVARRFALVAVAGELATQFGLTGWAAGEAFEGAKVCFESWLENVGGSGLWEEQKILAHVRNFIVSHGSSRFESIHGSGDQRIFNRVGFFRDIPDGPREYLFTCEGFKEELCKGFDEKLVKKTLRGTMMLNPDNAGRFNQNIWIPAIRSQARVYVIRYEPDARE